MNVIESRTERGRQDILKQLSWYRWVNEGDERCSEINSWKSCINNFVKWEEGLILKTIKKPIRKELVEDWRERKDKDWVFWVELFIFSTENNWNAIGLNERDLVVSRTEVIWDWSRLRDRDEVFNVNSWKQRKVTVIGTVNSEERNVGDVEGLFVGKNVGENEGIKVGSVEGKKVGLVEGIKVGIVLGGVVGKSVGNEESIINLRIWLLLVSATNAKLLFERVIPAGE